MPLTAPPHPHGPGWPLALLAWPLPARPLLTLALLPLAAWALPLAAQPPARADGAPGAGAANTGAAASDAGQLLNAPQRRLVLDRRRRRLLLLEGARELRRFPVAVGRPGWETPVGEFVVFERVRDPRWQHPATGQVVAPGPANPLGSRWIGFHRDCRGRRGFNGRQQLVVEGCVTAGFHGTPQRESVGRAISHGCVRLYEEHVRELYELVQLGTPVTVLP